MKPPTSAPVYACLYSELAELFREHGYALAVHGSLQRDFDLIAIPWTDSPSSPPEILSDIEIDFALKVSDGPAVKNHGRIAWSLAVLFGDCYIDISFMPAQVEFG